MITHYDLFAGIGGFSLALEEVFHEENIKNIFCEWEQFPTAVLKQHWPDGEYWGDITELVAHTDSARVENGRHLENEAGEPGSSHGITIVTGGFPCQPFSHAGRRQGTSDDRYKWPEMFAVIRNVRPDWVIAENVRGLVTWNEGMVLETVCADLESEGYEVQPIVVPAVAVGAPHRRDRVWIIAYRDGSGWKGGIREATRQHRLCGGDGGNQNQNSWLQDWREVALTTCHDGMDDGLSRWMDGVTISASRHRKERLKACGNAIVPQVAMQIFSAIKRCEYGEQI